jgi:hypothetical protein
MNPQELFKVALSTNPWHALLKEFRGRKSETLHERLGQWLFATDGAALIVECGKDEAASGSLEEKQKPVVLILMKKGKWQITLH